MEAYKEEKRKSKNEINDQFGRKMNQDVNGNRKLFWKEMSNTKRGRVENCSRIKDGNGRFGTMRG